MIGAAEFADRAGALLDALRAHEDASQLAHAVRVPFLLSTGDPGDLGTQESYDVRGGGWSNEPADLFNGGYLLTFGQYKGYGLSLMIDLLTGVLSGGGFSTQVRTLYKELEIPSQSAHLCAAIRVDAFGSSAVRACCKKPTTFSISLAVS